MDIQQIVGTISGAIGFVIYCFILKGIIEKIRTDNSQAIEKVRSESEKSLLEYRNEVEEKYAHKTTINSRFDTLDRKIDALSEKQSETNETLAKISGRINGNYSNNGNGGK